MPDRCRLWREDPRAFGRTQRFATGLGRRWPTLMRLPFSGQCGDTGLERYPVDEVAINLSEPHGRYVRARDERGHL